MEIERDEWPQVGEEEGEGSRNDGKIAGNQSENRTINKKKMFCLERKFFWLIKFSQCTHEKYVFISLTQNAFCLCGTHLTHSFNILCL